MLIDLFYKNTCLCYHGFIKEESKKEYFKLLDMQIENDYKKHVIFPAKNNIFKALSFFCISDAKLVIMGQDPYHTKDTADGLCFSTSNNFIPPSLKNIFKELESDLNIKRTNSNLKDWAEQGVFLLNTILTVKESQPLSHSKIGWETFTNNLLNYIYRINPEIIFLALGNNALNTYKKSLIPSTNIIHTSHPSFFSYSKGFKGSKVFSKINYLLEKKQKNIIVW
jgi:uracil-DNA glycosylase